MCLHFPDQKPLGVCVCDRGVNVCSSSGLCHPWSLFHDASFLPSWALGSEPQSQRYPRLCFGLE